MKLLRFHRGEDLLEISKEPLDMIKITIKPNTESIFPIFFILPRKSQDEIIEYLTTNK